MSDLRERAPAHSLIDELLRQWDLGTIHVDAANSVVIDDEALGWYRGVIGERRVADLLRELGEGWTVLHSVPVGKGTSDIDHVVIGPSGVFTINTKYSPNKDVWASGLGMYVGGFKQHYIRNSVGEARRASELLSAVSRLVVPVTGVLAFVDAKNLTIKTTPGEGDDGPEIKIVRDVRLLSALRGQQVFSEEQVAAIVDAAARPETWHQSPTDSTKASHIIREFEALEAEVGERLAVARVIPSQHTARRPSKTTARPFGQSTKRAPRSYANTSRQSTGRSPANRSRKKKETASERMVAQLLIAGVGIVASLIVAAVLMHY